MTVPSQAGLWSFTPQPGKVGRGAVLNVPIHRWYQWLAPRITLGPQQIQRRIVAEMGAKITPRGQNKQLKFYAGDVAFLPRLSGVLGWLFFAAMGDVTTATDEDSDGNVVTGLNSHNFHYASDQYYLPWIGSRFKTPGETSAQDSGEVGWDNKVRSLRITVPQMGQAAILATLQGRDFNFDNSPNAWTYTNAEFEDEGSIPLSSLGYLKLGGIEYPITGLVIDIDNALTDPRQEAIVGDTSPDDFKPLSRSVVVRFAYKYENAELCRLIYTGETDGTDWSPLPYSLLTVGDVPAFDLALEGPDTVAGTSPLSPHRLRLIGNKITITRDGPPQMQAGDIIVEQYTIEFETPAAGVSYADLILENGTASYVWPTLGSLAAPVLTISAATASYSGTAVAIAPAGTITDADSPDLDTGVIHGLLAGADYDNVNDNLLPVTGGGLTVTGANLIVSGQTVATFAGTGKTAAPLVITMNALCTPADAQIILRQLKYSRTGGATSTNVVTAAIYATDGDGNTSATHTVTITHS